MEGWDPWKVHLLVSNVQNLLHDTYTTGMGETESLPQLQDHKSVRGYSPSSPQNEVYPRKKKKRCSKIYLSREDKKSCLLPFTPSRRMHSSYQETIISSLIDCNDTTNSDFSNNCPLDVAISTHSSSLWDLGGHHG